MSSASASLEELTRGILETYRSIQDEEARLPGIQDTDERLHIQKGITEAWERIRRDYQALRDSGQPIPFSVSLIVVRAPWARSAFGGQPRAPQASSPVSSSPIGSFRTDSRLFGTGTLGPASGKIKNHLEETRTPYQSTHPMKLPKPKKRATKAPVMQNVPLRLDAAVPERVKIGRAFQLAVAVRLPQSAQLREEDLTLVRSGEMVVRWPAEAPFIRLRIAIDAPGCEIKEADSLGLRLFPGHDSPVLYFTLTPRRAGEIGIVVKVFQKTTTLGTARLLTRAQEEEVGQVRLNLVSSEMPQKAKPDPPHPVVSGVANVFLGIVVLGIVTNIVSGVIAGQLSSRMLWLTVPLGLAAGLALILINLIPGKKRKRKPA